MLYKLVNVRLQLKLGRYTIVSWWCWWNYRGGDRFVPCIRHNISAVHPRLLEMLHKDVNVWLQLKLERYTVIFGTVLLKLEEPLPNFWSTLYLDRHLTTDPLGWKWSYGIRPYHQTLPWYLFEKNWSKNQVHIALVTHRYRTLTFSPHKAKLTVIGSNAHAIEHNPSLGDPWQPKSANWPAILLKQLLSLMNQRQTQYWLIENM